MSDNRLSVGYLRMEEWFSRKTDPKERPREVIFGWGREPVVVFNGKYLSEMLTGAP